MRLRNKKTGEVVEPVGISCINGRYFIRFEDERGVFKYECRSLAQLNEEWEDYKEPKEYWYIDDTGVIQIDQALSSEINMRKSIGNYFNTREDAEKAVEKLKAWKWLKDKGFVFKGINENDGTIKTGLSKGVSLNVCEKFYDVMNLLFGGDE